MYSMIKHSVFPQSDASFSYSCFLSSPFNTYVCCVRQYQWQTFPFLCTCFHFQIATVQIGTFLVLSPRKDKAHNHNEAIERVELETRVQWTFKWCADSKHTLHFNFQFQIVARCAQWQFYTQTKWLASTMEYQRVQQWVMLLLTIYNASVRWLLRPVHHKMEKKQSEANQFTMC